jgi:hypothetical protein
VIPTDDELIQRIRRDLADSYDEEFELDLEDRNLDDMAESAVDTESVAYRESRRLYFRELFRLQGELVKLQDWVVKTGQKIVICFEGRDAAGKGRHHQAHHPASEPARVPRCRPARPQQPRENPVVLPALCGAPAGGWRNRAVRPQLVQPRRRRAP